MASRLALILLACVLAALNAYQYLQSGGGAPSRPGASPAPAPAREERAEDTAADPRAGVLRIDDPQTADGRRKYVPIGPGLYDKKWLGVTTLQHPFDMWTTQEIMFETRPDLVVETGTHEGGSATLWASILAQIVPDGRVLSIDIERKYESALEVPIVQERVDFLTGSSTAPEIVEEVRRRAEGKRVLVILDSLHDMEHVLGELEAYAPLVPVGGYVIVQDTHIGYTVPFWWYEDDMRWRAGAMAAVDAFLERHPEFEIDESRESFISSNNHRGWLKRVR